MAYLLLLFTVALAVLLALIAVQLIRIEKAVIRLAELVEQESMVRVE